MKDETQKLVDKMMKLGTGQWKHFVERKTKKPQDWQSAINQLNFLTTRYAMLAEYIAQRSGDYCGNKETHDFAVKKTLTVRAKVRQAIGFSSPRAGEFKF